MLRVPALLVALSINGCATEQETQVLVNQCDNPRPQVCTMEYDPVCARLGAGAQKTYSSPCNACADEAVTGFLPGACPE